MKSQRILAATDSNRQPLITITILFPCLIVSPPTAVLRPFTLPPPRILAVAYNPITAHGNAIHLDALRAHREPMSQDVNGDAQMFSDILHCVQWPRGLRCQVINVLGSWHVANIQKRFRIG